MTRGQLRVYLGAAPGVGKTFAMLSEGTRRQQRGADVVLGQVDDHGRTLTHALAEQIERCDVQRVGPVTATTPSQLDVEAVLRRHPEVVLIDDLASWWAEVETLLDAGIDVVSTLGVEQIASLADVVTATLGERPRSSVPDSFLRRAHQIELVDMTPEALLRRIAHGNVFGADEQADVVSQWSSPDTLNTLRRHALIWLADGLRQAGDADGREKVVVAVTGAEGNDTVILRAARLALRTRSDLIGVHVADTHRGLMGADGRPRRSGALLDQHRQLLIDLGGSFHELADDDIAGALVAFARSQAASRLVMGASRRSRLSELTTGSIVREVIRRAGDLEVHVMSDVAPTIRPPVAVLRWWSGRGVFHRRQVLLGCAVGAACLSAVTLVGTVAHADLSVVLSLLLLTVVVCARLGGRIPAFTVAAVSPFVANVFFVAPRGSLRIAQRSSLLELLAFLAVALLTSSAVTGAVRQARQASMLASDAETLAEMSARRTGNAADDLAMITDAMRRRLGLDVLEVRATVAEARHPEPRHPEPRQPDPPVVRVDLDDGWELVGWGPPIDSRSQRLLPLFATQLRSVIVLGHAEEQGAVTHSLREADALKLSLLQTVSHDLRTPLGGIKAAVSSLREPDVQWTADDSAYFLQTIEENTDRLTTMVTNVLDFSRLQSGTLKPILRAAALEEIVPAAVASLGRRGQDVVLHIPAGLPDVLTDPPLVERVVANLIANAITWSPPGQQVLVHGAAVNAGAPPGTKSTPGPVVPPCAREVCLQVIDHGPGIAPQDRARVMEPFERATGTMPNASGGVGLGLAIAGGLTQSLGGSLRLRDTPGGGLTVELTLPVAP